MTDNFWEMIEDPALDTDDQAIEIIRRCGSTQIFKSVQSRVSVAVEYARVLHPRKPLRIEGSFSLVNHESVYKGIPARIVCVDITIMNQKGMGVLKSQLFLYVSEPGRIVGVSNEV